MGFLDKLITAVRQDSSTADVLRAIRALADRIDSVDLAAWADRELLGYGDEDPLPAYRGPLESEIHVLYRGRAARMSELPPTAFAEELRNSTLMRLYDVTLVEPVEQLENLARAGAPLVRPWRAVHVDLINRLIDFGGLTLGPGDTIIAAAENRLDASLLRKVLDTVRDRVLGLALSLERVAPDAGDQGGPSRVSSAMRKVIENTISPTGSRKPADR